MSTRKPDKNAILLTGDDLASPKRTSGPLTRAPSTIPSDSAEELLAPRYPYRVPLFTMLAMYMMY